jgi:hypothetical protein
MHNDYNKRLILVGSQQCDKNKSTNKIISAVSKTSLLC